jgi:TetR/AcrR family transcriptional regulator, regulator of cefoperazone and chloramphenicol sensitivity
MNMSHLMKATEQVCIDTRQRLLEAAGEVFAEQGFRAATIRDICTKAGANVAAINYHFGDKQNLYAEVLKYAYERSRAKFPSDMGLAPDATPQQRLQGFVRALVYRILDQTRYAWHGTLMFREMVEPTRALDSLIDQGIRPEFERLKEIVQALLGPRADGEEVLQCVWSITGQCLFHYYAKYVTGRLRSQGAYCDEDVQRIADHVVRFSLSAIQCLTDKKVTLP